MIAQKELRAEAIGETVQAVAQAYSPLQAAGYVVPDTMIDEGLMTAARAGISLAAVCRDLATSASRNAMREVIKQRRDATPLRQYEAALHAAWQARHPPPLQKRALAVGLDEHDEPG